MNRKILIPLLAALVGALVIAGCGDDDSGTTSADGSATEATTDDGSGSGGDVDTSTKPEVEVPDGPAPDELEVVDIVEGDGATAEPGSLVTVQYVGVTYDDGEQFDASWDRGQPFPFQLGGGSVIEGWEEGVEGMKVGGRRMLIIPPDMAYGKQGSPPDIGPDETLIFVVDLLDVG